MHEYMVEILIFVITVCGIVITKTIIPYFKQLIKNSEYSDVYDLIEIAVRAAEQKCKTPKQGRSKKAEVYTFISHWLDSKGIRLTEDEIDRMIEAAVYSMNEEM